MFLFLLAIKDDETECRISFYDIAKKHGKLIPVILFCTSTFANAKTEQAVLRKLHKFILRSHGSLSSLALTVYLY